MSSRLDESLKDFLELGKTTKDIAHDKDVGSDEIIRCLPFIIYVIVSAAVAYLAGTMMLTRKDSDYDKAFHRGAMTVLAGVITGAVFVFVLAIIRLVAQ